MKVFETVDMNVIKDCQTFFKFKSPSDLLDVRTKNFLTKLYAIMTISVCSIIRETISKGFLLAGAGANVL